MNNATFAGRLGRDAELRHTQGGTAILGFSIAVDERGPNGDKATLWIDCSLWGDRGQALEEFLVKGKVVAVSGRVGVRTYESQGETKATITLKVAEVTLLGGGEQREGGERQQPARQAASQPARAPTGQSAPRQAPAARAPAPAPKPDADFSDDDIPF